MELENIARNCDVRLNKLRKELKCSLIGSEYKDITIYVCGSLARGEMVGCSDLDLFFIDTRKSTKQKSIKCISESNLKSYQFFTKLYKINKENGYQDPSKEGLYWRFTSLSDLLDIGSSVEDYNNGFTARMLLILESKPLYNEKIYNATLKKVMEEYFSEYQDHCDDFYPLYLINDILRYWYTLTLNYEYHRDKNDDISKKNWRRLKLKFARLLTCFSFIACLCFESTNPDKAIKIVKLSPLERLDLIGSKNDYLNAIVMSIKNEYEYFINLHNENATWWESDVNKNDAFRHASIFHKLLINDFIGGVLKDSRISDKLELVSIINNI